MLFSALFVWRKKHGGMATRYAKRRGSRVKCSPRVAYPLRFVRAFVFGRSVLARLNRGPLAIQGVCTYPQRLTRAKASIVSGERKISTFQDLPPLLTKTTQRKVPGESLHKMLTMPSLLFCGSFISLAQHSLTSFTNESATPFLVVR